MPCVDPEKRRAWKRADYAKNRDKYCAQKRERYARDPEPFKEICRLWRARNPGARAEKDAAYGRAYYAANREAVLKRTSAYEKRRYASDWQYAEARRVRCRIRDAFRRAGARKPCSAMELLGCNAEAFVNAISAQFCSGMSYDNRNEWHIDHIYPLCAADLHDELQARAVAHWRNLRPMWGAENCSKGGKVTPEAEKLFASIMEDIRLQRGDS